MKVKSLLLSMCAIAALASCSQNDDEITSVNDAPEAKVTIKFAGSGAATRAGGIGTNDAVVKDLTVFFFNASGALIKTPQAIASQDLNTSMTLTTTTDAASVFLAANIGGIDVSGATSIANLKKILVSSIGTPTASDYLVTQTKDNLTMGGWGAVVMDAGGNTGTAAVALHFIAAKINSLAVTWGAANQGHYAGTEGDVVGDKWFTIKRAYLMLAQTNSPLLPAAASPTQWNGEFTPSAFAYAGGVDWATSPWGQVTPPVTPTPVLSSSYMQSTIPAEAADAVKILNDDASAGTVTDPWYVFENNSTNLTGVILEVVHQVKDQSTGVIANKVGYLTVYFGEKDGNTTQTKILAGHTHAIKLTINASFDPNSGTGGGTTPDPTKPSVAADITVAVTPAAWTAAPVIEKEFN
jgi:hypothetical protein